MTNPGGIDPTPTSFNDLAKFTDQQLQEKLIRGHKMLQNDPSQKWVVQAIANINHVINLREQGGNQSQDPAAENKFNAPGLTDSSMIEGGKAFAENLAGSALLGGPLGMTGLPLKTGSLVGGAAKVAMNKFLPTPLRGAVKLLSNAAPTIEEETPLITKGAGSRAEEIATASSPLTPQEMYPKRLQNLTESNRLGSGTPPPLPDLPTVQPEFSVENLGKSLEPQTSIPEPSGTPPSGGSSSSSGPMGAVDWMKRLIELRGK